MSFALITFENIHPNDGKYVRWVQILGNLEESLNTPLGTEKIQENVWLIPLPGALQVLNASTHLSDNMNVSYKIALFDKDKPKFS